MPLVRAESHGGIRQLASDVEWRLPLPLGVVEVIGRSSRAREGQRFGVHIHPARGDVFGLLGRSTGSPLGPHFAALTEVAPAIPDNGRGRGVLRFLPHWSAAVLAEATESTVQGCQIDVPLGQHWACDDLPGERLFPDLTAGAQLEGRETVLVIATAVRISKVDAAAADG